MLEFNFRKKHGFSVLFQISHIILALFVAVAPHWVGSGRAENTESYMYQGMLLDVLVDNFMLFECWLILEKPLSGPLCVSDVYEVSITCDILLFEIWKTSNYCSKYILCADICMPMKLLLASI